MNGFRARDNLRGRKLPAQVAFPPRAPLSQHFKNYRHRIGGRGGPWVETLLEPNSPYADFRVVGYEGLRSRRFSTTGVMGVGTNGVWPTT